MLSDRCRPGDRRHPLFSGLDVLRLPAPKQTVLVRAERSARIRICAGPAEINEWKRAWKIELVEADNPHWIDLYPSLSA
jgi:hypothetical protein